MNERIEQIKKRLKNTPKSCLNEKYAEDIKYLLELYENKNKDFMKLQAFYSGDYVIKLNLIEENQKEIEELERANDILKNQKEAARKINELLIERYRNSVPKQKIIDKIEELRKKCLSCTIKKIIPNECDNLCVYKVAIKELGKLIIE